MDDLTGNSPYSSTPLCPSGASQSLVSQTEMGLGLFGSNNFVRNIKKSRISPWCMLKPAIPLWKSMRTGASGTDSNLEQHSSVWGCHWNWSFAPHVMRWHLLNQMPQSVSGEARLAWFGRPSAWSTKKHTKSAYVRFSASKRPELARTKLKPSGQRPLSICELPPWELSTKQEGHDMVMTW